MDITVQTTTTDAKTAIAAAPTDVTASSVAVLATDDPRIAAARDAATALVAAAGLGPADPVEVSLALSDTPGWAVVRVAKVILAP